MPKKALSPQIKSLPDYIRGLPSITNNIKPISLFDGVSEDTLKNLLTNSMVTITEQDREIVRQGDEVNYLYFIIEGSIRILRSNSDGDEATNNLLQDGETFMEAVIFMGGISPVRAKAVKNSKLLLIPARVIRRLVLQDGQLGHNLLRIISKHQKESWQQLDSIVTKTPVERVGYYVLKLLIEKASDTVDIELPFQKTLIANYLGMTPETFSRALKKLKTEGVGVDNEHITLSDFFSLCRFCDSDTAFVCPKHGTSGCSSRVCHG